MKRCVYTLALPLSIILITSLCGVFLWGGMDFYVLGLPASIHDFTFLAILAVSISIDADRRDEDYYSLVAWFVAALFLLQSLLQIIDIRPPGDTGKYDLYIDNLSNALLIVAFMTVTYLLLSADILKPDKRVVFLSWISCLFLAGNALLTIPQIREWTPNYALVYDIAYYLMVYAAVISTNRYLNDFVCNRVCRRLYLALHRRRVSLQKDKAAGR